MSNAGGFLYAIGAEGTTLVKIGYAKNVEKRLKTLQTGQPFPLRLIAAIPVEEDIQRIERQVHAFLVAERRRGEWFDVPMSPARLEALIVQAIASMLREATPLPQEEDCANLPLMQRVGRRVHTLRRLRLRLSQQRLGEMVGKDQAYISRLERGGMPDITVGTLERLMQALHVSADYLLGSDAPAEDEDPATVSAA